MKKKPVKMSGPACGCQEHNEARRREVNFMKKAYQLQASNKLNSRQPDFDKKHCSCSSYSCCIQRKNDDAIYGKYSYEGLTPEEARRLAEYEKQMRKPLDAYTAKLPFRLNPTLDINFVRNRSRLDTLNLHHSRLSQPNLQQYRTRIV